MRKRLIAFLSLIAATTASAQERTPTVIDSSGRAQQADPIASMDQVANGTLAATTLGSTYVITLGHGEATVAMAIAGLTASGATLAVEYSDDRGATWANIRTIGNAVTPGTATLTTDGGVTINGAGHTRLRLRVSVVGTGTITVTSNASTATKGVTLEGTQPPPLGVTTTPTAFTGSATANTFTSALAASSARKGCTIFSATAFSVSPGTSPTAATAIPAGATQGGFLFSCSNPVGFVMQDQINVSSATASVAYVVWTQ